MNKESLFVLLIFTIVVVVYFIAAKVLEIYVNYKFNKKIQENNKKLRTGRML